MSTRTGLVTRAASAMAALVAVAFALLGTSAAQGIDWRKLPYFDYSLQLLSLATDGSWQGAQVIDAGVFNPTDGSGPSARRRYIWAATCAEGEQFVSFSKTITVPGAPIEATVALSYGPGNHLYGDRPYKSAVLLVNSREAARLGDIAASPRTVAPMFRGPLPPPVLSALPIRPECADDPRREDRSQEGGSVQQSQVRPLHWRARGSRTALRIRPTGGAPDESPHRQEERRKQNGGPR